MIDHLHWMATQTKTRWWADSIDPEYLRAAIASGASGATSNPFLVHQAIDANREPWGDAIAAALSAPAGIERAVVLTELAVTRAADALLPVWESSAGADGFVCAQVDPSAAADRGAMLALARTYHAWRPNISVKLPTTAAGLDVLDQCIANGISCTMTVSFTAAQITRVADRYVAARDRAYAAGAVPGRCHAVMMIGRLDEYLRDVSLDGGHAIAEADIGRAGIVTTRRVLDRVDAAGDGFDLIVAALRSTEHLTELTGSRVVMSIAPSIRALIDSRELDRVEHVGSAEDDAATVERLSELAEFIRAYEPDGMAISDFLTFGASQRTLSQFIESGWKLLERFEG